MKEMSLETCSLAACGEARRTRITLREREACLEAVAPPRAKAAQEDLSGAVAHLNVPARLGAARAGRATLHESHTCDRVYASGWVGEG